MFNTSRHTTRYWKIIDFARQQKRSKGGDIYYETHHIIPKCLGGEDHCDNLVLLTAREHFLAHFLLTKMTDHIGLHYAFMLFKCEQITNHYFNSRFYESARKEQSARRKGIKFGKEHREKLARAKRGAAGNNRQWWTITDPFGKTTVTFDRREFCTKNNLNWESVKVMTQKSPNYKGYTFVKGKGRG